jgi:hypothetical protein
MYLPDAIHRFVKVAQANVEEINDETITQDQAHHPTIEEALRYRTIDCIPELLTKYLDDDLPTWMPLDTLFQQNPRAVQSFLEDNGIDIKRHLPTYLQNEPTIHSEELKKQLYYKNVSENETFDTTTIPPVSKEKRTIATIRPSSKQQTSNEQTIANLTEMMEPHPTQLNEDENSGTDTTLRRVRGRALRKRRFFSDHVTT